MGNDHGNGNGSIQSMADKAAGSAMLTTVARVFAVITPMALAPLLVWLFATVADNQKSIVRVEVQTQANTERIGHLETGLTDLADYIRKSRDERQRDWFEIRERMTRVETQNTSILDELKLLNQKLDERRSK